MKTEEILARDVEIGDKIRLIGSYYFTVEWKGIEDSDRVYSVYLAGHLMDGRPHVQSTVGIAKLDRLTE